MTVPRKNHRSPVTIIPSDKEIINGKKLLPVTGKYQNVKKTKLNPAERLR